MKKYLLIFVILSIVSCDSNKKEDNTDPLIDSTSNNDIIEDINNLETKELEENDVPEKVKETIEYQFTGYKIEKYEIISNGNYKLVLVKNDKYSTVTITPTGKIIKIDS
jgi:hypothetical protein